MALMPRAPRLTDGLIETPTETLTDGLIETLTETLTDGLSDTVQGNVSRRTRLCAHGQNTQSVLPVTLPAFAPVSNVDVNSQRQPASTVRPCSFMYSTPVSRQHDDRYLRGRVRDKDEHPIVQPDLRRSVWQPGYLPRGVSRLGSRVLEGLCGAPGECLYVKESDFVCLRTGERRRSTLLCSALEVSVISVAGSWEDQGRALEADSLVGWLHRIERGEAEECHAMKVLPPLQ